ncbi:hypothetical protein DNK03_22955 [Brucella anthropi]|uniref:glycosyltransferase family 2 protein n=1 Tax=Brucella TaxID=234 RepID=UPI000DED307B|nr:glycosyltransferase [Brucella anthropi]KAB2791314.1 glycosyltransferase [Brucella anthropi]RCI77005.1 hypothetical protein DNK03_22955 [Brucella anthropi]
MPNSFLSHDVIVCVHNGLDDVKHCLDSLISYWDRDILNRLIIVDDCSGAETKDFLSQFKKRNTFVDVLSLKKQHYYTKAANSGLRESDAQIRTLLNSDTIVTENWASKIQTVFSLNDCIGIVGPLSNAASTQSVPFVKGSKEQTAINELPPEVSIKEFGDFIEKIGTGKTLPFVPLVHGFCLSIRDKVLDNIGYFDEEAFPRGYGEENDFCFRTEDAGYVLAIAVDTFIFHAKSKSYTTSDRVQFMHMGMKKLSEKHGVERIKSAVKFMEENPHLQSVRKATFENWPLHYTS